MARRSDTDWSDRRYVTDLDADGPLGGYSSHYAGLQRYNSVATAAQHASLAAVLADFRGLLLRWEEGPYAGEFEDGACPVRQSRHAPQQEWPVNRVAQGWQNLMDPPPFDRTVPPERRPSNQVRRDTVPARMRGL